MDTGEGIDENYLPHIFEDFSQEDESLTRKHEGTGLGMSIVKELVLSLGGEIQISSVKGKGTTVEFFIKTKEINETVPSSKNIDVEKSSELAQEIPLNILVVDDDMVGLMTETKLLMSLGYNPDTAMNGKIAFDCCKKKKYDLIFMDIRMPIMDGISSSIEIFNLPSEVRPIIIPTTGDATTENLENCKKIGMTDFLSKPVRKKYFITIIEKYFKKRMSA